MKVLFVPLPGFLAHTIPLVALNKKLSASSVETAFLSPQKLHHVLKQMGAEALPIDHRGIGPGAFRSEMKAYGMFSPDVVVDDASLTTGFATAFKGVPRVTIQRTGMFVGSEPRNKNHHFSLTTPRPEDVPDVSFLGLRQPRNFHDFFEADSNIVPGIPSIEVLPPNLRDDPSYAFSGPLILNDDLMGQTIPGILEIPREQSFQSLQDFFKLHHGRKIVFVTFGTQAVATPLLLECIRFILDSDIAVVTSVEVKELTAEQRKLYYFAHYLPMHFVCTHADLMIHQCGSGTYHYPILHNVPTITIGTQCFDREDVALRLEELGTSTHIPSPVECPDFADRFKRAIADYFFHDGRLLEERKLRLLPLKTEIEATIAAFDFEGFLRQAVSAAKKRTASQAG